MKKIFSKNGFFFFAAVLALAVFALYSLSLRQKPLSGESLLHGLEEPYTAPEIAGIEGWLNSSPLTLAELKGKVVLIDFWTYSCINCIRTLPHVVSWYNAYKDDGLVVIGVHTPEFGFEKKPDNINKAIKKHQITYPVAIDNAWKTWQAFDNHYWPAHYLIDRQGNVVYTHFGEGGYDVMENNIRFLLGTKSKMAEKPKQKQSAATDQSPETYLGYTRSKNFASPEALQKNSIGEYSLPARIPLHHWALQGKWVISPENVTALSAGARIQYHFRAGKVFLVLGTEIGQHVMANIYLDGKKVKDIEVAGETLYDLISLSSPKDGIVEIESTAPGLQAYAFTFGQ